MKKKSKQGEYVRNEYNREELGSGIRGKYLAAYNRGANLVLLSPDVAKAFPTEKDVNEALRSLLELAQKAAGQKKRTSNRRTKTPA
jgi:hypothetical protein